MITNVFLIINYCLVMEVTVTGINYDIKPPLCVLSVKMVILANKCCQRIIIKRASIQ